VLRELEALVRRARSAGHGIEVLAALKEIQHRLSIYPQFGERLMNLHQTGETLWVAAIPPLVVRYVIDETIRTVFIGTPFLPLPNAGFE
jgi:hypothetical protein